MKNKLTRFLALFLVISLLSSMLPLSVSAAPKYRLNGLRANNGVTLNPTFRATTYQYESIVPYGTRRTRVVASARFSREDVEAGAHIEVNGEEAPSSGQGVEVELSEGSNTITVRVIDAAGEYNEYAIDVYRLEQGKTAVKITTDTLPDGVVGRRYSAKISATGSGSKYFYLENDLPDGLTFNEDNGQISGIPQVGSEASYNIACTVESSDTNTSARKTFRFRIYERGTNLQEDDDEDEPSSSQPSSTPRPPATTKPTTATNSQQNVINQVQTRINSAAAGATVSPRFRNLGSVELATLQTIAKAAGSRTLRLSSERQYGDGLTESRVTIDPKASTKTISMLSSTSISSDNCKNVTALMNRFYSNQVSVIRLDQKGSYGQTVTVYAKLDNTRLNTSSLRFYSYDSAANTLNAINTNYRVSDTGYVTFNTTVGNYVIVTDSAMRRK